MASELLTDKAISNAKPGDKPRTLKDGNGLFVLIHPNGSKYFQLRATLHGRAKLIQLGIYPDKSLADARADAKAARSQLADGVDPVREKRKQAIAKAADAASTFEAVATEWLKIKERTLAPTSYRSSRLS